MIVVFWRGHGWLVAVVTFGCLLLSDWLTGRYFHDNDYYARNGWPKLVGFLVAAGIIWGLNRLHGDDVPVDDQDRITGSSASKDHDMFFLVPMRYWPKILPVVGLVFFFIRD